MFFAAETIFTLRVVSLNSQLCPSIVTLTVISTSPSAFPVGSKIDMEPLLLSIVIQSASVPVDGVLVIVQLIPLVISSPLLKTLNFLVSLGFPD